MLRDQGKKVGSGFGLKNLFCAWGLVFKVVNLSPVNTSKVLRDTQSPLQGCIQIIWDSLLLTLTPKSASLLPMNQCIFLSLIPLAVQNIEVDLLSADQSTK